MFTARYELNLSLHLRLILYFSSPLSISFHYCSYQKANGQSLETFQKINAVSEIVERWLERKGLNTSNYFTGSSASLLRRRIGWLPRRPRRRNIRCRPRRRYILCRPSRRYIRCRPSRRYIRCRPCTRSSSCSLCLPCSRCRPCSLCRRSSSSKDGSRRPPCHLLR